MIKPLPPTLLDFVHAPARRSCSGPQPGWEFTAEAWGLTQRAHAIDDTSANDGVTYFSEVAEHAMGNSARESSKGGRSWQGVRAQFPVHSVRGPAGDFPRPASSCQTGQAGSTRCRDFGWVGHAQEVASTRRFARLGHPNSKLIFFALATT